jgi:hypothetical protein
MGELNSLRTFKSPGCNFSGKSNLISLSHLALSHSVGRFHFARPSEMRGERRLYILMCASRLWSREMGQKSASKLFKLKWQQANEWTNGRVREGKRRAILIWSHSAAAAAARDGPLPPTPSPKHITPLARTHTQMDLTKGSGHPDADDFYIDFLERRPCALLFITWSDLLRNQKVNHSKKLTCVFYDQIET